MRICASFEQQLTMEGSYMIENEEEKEQRVIKSKTKSVSFCSWLIVIGIWINFPFWNGVRFGMGDTTSDDLFSIPLDSHYCF